jgi:hypothetical protein
MWFIDLLLCVFFGSCFCMCFVFAIICGSSSISIVCFVYLLRIFCLLCEMNVPIDLFVVGVLCL